MQFEKLMIEKILSNQNQKDKPIGTRIKMNNNIIEEFAVDDKFILLHTVRVKQKKTINTISSMGDCSSALAGSASWA